MAFLLPEEKKTLYQWAAKVAFDLNVDTFLERIKSSFLLTDRCFEVRVEKLGVEIAT